MKTEFEYPFTADQFKALTTEERHAVLAVAEFLTGSTIEVSDEQLSQALNLMREPEGCVPTEETGDDLLASVRRKFAAVYQVGLQLAEAELDERGLTRQERFNFCLVIDPSYEDATHVVILDYDRPVYYLHEWSKAWHFGFENLAALAAAVLSVRVALVNKVDRLHATRGS